MDNKINTLFVIPDCLHCGGKPEIKKKSVESCRGWATDYHEWIECKCGMRTIDRETTYHRQQIIEELIGIFGGNNKEGIK